MNIRIKLCKYFGWHKQPKLIECIYGQMYGMCPVCKKEILLDSQGNWF